MQTERDAVDAAVLSSDDLHENLKSLVVLGLMVARKWDRADTNHPAPTPAQVARFDVFTDTEAKQFSASASILLRDYVAFVPKAAPQSFWLPVWQGVVSAFFYSLFLIVAAVLAKLGGHDLIDILREALKPG